MLLRQAVGGAVEAIQLVLFHEEAGFSPMVDAQETSIIAAKRCPAEEGVVEKRMPNVYISRSTWSCGAPFIGFYSRAPRGSQSEPLKWAYLCRTVCSARCSPPSLQGGGIVANWSCLAEDPKVEQT